MSLPTPSKNGGIRISLADSPRRSPLITHAVTSPVKSVSPEHHSGESMMHMETIESQVNMAQPTADFFDDDSDDAESLTTVEHVSGPESISHEQPLLSEERKLPPTARRLASQLETRRATYPVGVEGYHRLSARPHLTGEPRLAETASSSYAGSVDELLPSEHLHTPRFPRPARLPSNRTPRSSGAYESNGETRTLAYPENAEHILNAHAIAHEITLHALMRDEGATEHGLQFATLDQSIRNSFLPPSLRVHDPRSPKEQCFGSSTGRIRSNKKVQVVPPPIDTSMPRRSMPHDIIRTPYPFQEEHNVFRKDSGHNAPSTHGSSRSASESVLTLSIRRGDSNRALRTASLTIPATNEFSAVRSGYNGTKEEYFQALIFDDKDLFREMRSCYAKMAGLARFLSARSLSRIVVSGPASRAADADYGWLHQPRSPRYMTDKRLSDSFSERHILQHYRKPSLGRSRYAFVHWAHRLAATPSTSSPTAQSRSDEAKTEHGADLNRRPEQHEGLEFIVTWSIKRILSALTLVLVLSLAATLLWTFLGKNTAPDLPQSGGFLDAGDRVGVGVLIGICVLLTGLGGIAGWLGLSWLIL